VHVINDPVTAFKVVSDLKTIRTDSLGVSMSGKYFNLVLWGSISEDAIDSQLMINLPDGSYNTQPDAQADVNETANYSIPEDFRGTGFLIGRIVMRHQTAGGGTWTHVQTVDLRGLFPSTAAGGGSGLSEADADSLYFRLDGGNQPITGPFASRGIDDTAVTATRLKINNTSFNIGDAAGTVFGLLRDSNTGGFFLSGGSGNSTGGSLALYGSSSSTPYDFALRGNSGSNVIFFDDSVGTLTVSTGIGPVKTNAIVINSIQDIYFDSDLLEVGNNGVFTIEHWNAANNQAIQISGSSGVSGATLTVYGVSHGTRPGDLLMSGPTGSPFFIWDESVGDLEILTGVGTKTNAITIDANRKTNFKASAAAAASINLAEGVAPSSPVDGDMWVTTTDILARINGVSQSLLSGGYTHPNHSGHVTSVGDGATTLVVAAITGQTALTSGLATTDEFLINDGGVIKRMDVSVLTTHLNSNLTIDTAIIAAAAIGRSQIANSTTTSAGSLSSSSSVNINLNDWALFPMVHASATDCRMSGNSVDGTSAANPRFALRSNGAATWDVDHRWIIAA
jgi:hypothetical protein